MLRLIIVKSTINNRMLQQMQLLIVDAAIFCRHQISLDRPPLRKKTLESFQKKLIPQIYWYVFLVNFICSLISPTPNLRELHLTELALK